MKKLLLVGAGGFGRVVLEHAIQQYDCSFLDDNCTGIINGALIVGKTTDIEKLYGQYKLLIVTIGNNILREEIYSVAKRVGYDIPNIIDPSAYISPYASMGSGCIVLNNAVVQNNVKIGNGVILNPGVELHHDSVVGNNVTIYTNSVVRSGARICDRVSLGSTLTIGNNVVVEKDSIIGDGETISF
ncbi:MAG: lipid carrier--UDP-N-acetylgalactosaminyltransferase [Oscillospiraceae bacterium]|nr:lipid carrier--UDP-N-acetylgalactosaminyltransferase [Oscillospiraceae bacterium]